jgi:hypothetical protein
LQTTNSTEKKETEQFQGAKQKEKEGASLVRVRCVIAEKSWSNKNGVGGRTDRLLSTPFSYLLSKVWTTTRCVKEEGYHHNSKERET